MPLPLLNAGQRHGRDLYVALKCIPVHSTCLSDCEECLPTMVVDTSPPLHFMQTGRVRGLHPLSTLFAAFQKLVLTVQSIEPTSRQSFNFRVDHSMGSTHTATLESMIQIFMHTGRISWNCERCLPTTVAGIRMCSSSHVSSLANYICIRLRAHALSRACVVRSPQMYAGKQHVSPGL